MSERQEIGNCRECRYYRGVNDRETMGQCRRYAPRIVEGMLSLNPVGDPEDRLLAMADAVFPMVIDEEWCGEWQPSKPLPMAGGAVAPINGPVLMRQEFANRLGLNFWQVERLRRAGLIPEAEKVGRYFVFPESKVEAIRNRLASQGHIQAATRAT